MPRTRLADALERLRGPILETFLHRLYATTVPADVDRERALDSAEELIGEVVASLRAHAEAAGTRPLARDATFSDAARSHGLQRFGMGYDLAAVIREYGVLTDVILEQLGRSPSTSPEPEEVRALVAYVTSAIARAAEHYAIARDHDVESRTARHIGFLAHELRIPLGSAKLAIAVARENGELRSGRAADAIERAHQRLSALIDGALVEIRMRTGVALELESIAIGKLLAELAEDSAAEIEAKALALRHEVSGQPIVEGDRRLLRSAISNLIRNAVKFSARGGSIALRARVAMGRVIVEVEDSCGGLPHGAVGTLFDPFVQGGRDRSGFGLGLAIADQAVRAHQGSLRVHDLPGHGCVFVAHLFFAPSDRSGASALCLHRRLPAIGRAGGHPCELVRRSPS